MLVLGIGCFISQCGERIVNDSHLYHQNEVFLDVTARVNVLNALSRFETGHTFSFIPRREFELDDEFKLMSYCPLTSVKPLICHRKPSREQGRVYGQDESAFKDAEHCRQYGNLCAGADNATPTGGIQYAPDKLAFVWKIKQLEVGGS
ncbi:hypothetical protein BDQ12DRAFT_665765 [Crucibulum laeve]|uniref:Uncharacterized protein n=1 Tax=Crucibulum laeve TaxID=68775 RepID=A0A5C3M0N4_9AGAR|nr:hypothetical protein BDQ12DRAFT_665765 [Crucibulum laeve]